MPAHVPVSVLYPGADLEVFRPDLPTADLRERHGVGDRPLIVCVSRLVARKGQDVLIRAMPKIRRRVPEAVLLIVGGGPYLSTLERLAAGRRAGPSCSRPGLRGGPAPVLRGRRRVRDAVPQPARRPRGRGLGNVFIEAAACGRPVVVGDSGGAREALVDGETGLLVDGTDVDRVAGAVGDLLADPSRAAAMGAAGRARVERDHAWPRIAERLAGWLREAVD